VEEQRCKKDLGLETVRSRDRLSEGLPGGRCGFDPFDKVSSLGPSQGPTEIIVGLVTLLLKIDESTGNELEPWRGRGEK
jgi:hypothetical protein